MPNGVCDMARPRPQTTIEASEQLNAAWMRFVRVFVWTCPLTRWYLRKIGIESEEV